MTDTATQEQKQYMFDLIKEMQGYSETIQNKLQTLTIKERISIGKRMAVIVKEMKDFRRDYPDD
jgi:hypothetical protein